MVSLKSEDSALCLELVFCSITLHESQHLEGKEALLIVI